MKLTSGAFSQGNMIPVKFTGDGPDLSPPLKWEGVPAKTKSLAIICDDPDAPAGTWVHWVMYNISPTKTELNEGVPQRRTLDDGTTQGINDFHKIGYGGPMPPSGTHHYNFKLYALDEDLHLQPGLTKASLLQNMRGHVIDECTLMGTYHR